MKASHTAPASLLCISLFAMACASAGGSAPPSPYLAACPRAPSTPGYPVAVTTDGSAKVDSSWLDAVARAAAYRWVVPTRTRGLNVLWRSVRSRILPPEPRWADDWFPDARHRAALAVTVYAGGRTSSPELLRASGDESFDESLATIVEDPMPGSPPFPPLPGSDSVRLVFTFGEEPAGLAGVTRFATQQTPASSPVIDRSRMSFGLARGVVKYDVDANGTVVPGSVEILEELAGQLPGTFVRQLTQLRFEPARSNCRPVAVTVLQIFGR